MRDFRTPDGTRNPSASRSLTSALQHPEADAIGDHAIAEAGTHGAAGSDRVRRQVYLIALERGFLDTILDRFVVEPFTRLAGVLTRLDQWLCDALLPARLPAAVDGGDQDE